MSSWFEIILVVVGLIAFEVVSSIDNAVINANIISTVSERARRWFLTWGLIIAVFVVRGLLPFLVVLIAQPSLGLVGAFTAAFSSDPTTQHLIEQGTPVLLAGGGIYLILLFLHWLLQEDKHYAFGFERALHQRFGLWFYAAASIVLVGIVWATQGTGNPLVTLSAVIGSSAFFITSGFKASAEAKEAELTNRGQSDISKLLYLELIDATFSIDGVLGAFAFTTAVPLILIGNGIGAVIIRQITIHGVSTVAKLPYLSNGAMYSVGVLGTIMITDALGVEVPFWVSPLVTIAILSYFLWRSRIASASK